MNLIAKIIAGFIVLILILNLIAVLSMRPNPDVRWSRWSVPVDTRTNGWYYNRGSSSSEPTLSPAWSRGGRCSNQSRLPNRPAVIPQNPMTTAATSDTAPRTHAGRSGWNKVIVPNRPRKMTSDIFPNMTNGSTFNRQRNVR